MNETTIITPETVEKTMTESNGAKPTTKAARPATKPSPGNLKAKSKPAAKPAKKVAKATISVGPKKVEIMGKTTVRVPGNNHFDDDANAVAKASDGTLNTAQVRIMRALRKARRPLDRKEIKEAVGLGHKKGFHITWVESLMSLTPKLVKVEQHEPEGGRPAHYEFTLTAKGRDTLEAVEKAAKARK